MKVIIVLLVRYVNQDRQENVLLKRILAVASSDSVVLDKCGKWVDLAGEIIKNRIPTAKIIDLRT
jgi:hypothetical protein